MANLNTQDGFDFNNKLHTETDVGLAFVSLKVALKSYFSTYQTFKGHLYIFNDSEITTEEIDYYHRNSYCEAYAETIVHFQHFSELVCKKILKDKKGALSLYARYKDGYNNGKLKLLGKWNKSISQRIEKKLKQGNELTLEEHEKLMAINAHDVIQELDKYASNLGFDFSNHKGTCEELNYLRNSILHKGIFILHYPKLDIFIGRKVLPFVKAVLELPDFSNKENIWQYNQLHYDICPIEEIIKESTSSLPDIGKLALLKELGRASYKSPLSRLHRTENTTQNLFFPSGFLDTLIKSFDIREVERAERIAKLEALQNYSQVEICPVCGIESLIIYDDRVKCECCTFSLERSDVKNVSEYGFNSIGSYWIDKIL
jgi:hypothetical protein